MTLPVFMCKTTFFYPHSSPTNAVNEKKHCHGYLFLGNITIGTQYPSNRPLVNRSQPECPNLSLAIIIYIDNVCTGDVQLASEIPFTPAAQRTADMGSADFSVQLCLRRNTSIPKTSSRVASVKTWKPFWGWCLLRILRAGISVVKNKEKVSPLRM